MRDYECEIQEQILAELYIRKAIKALKNELSSAFKFLNLISLQTHIKEVLYEYFDIVFSLKERVVLKARFINDFITAIILTNDEKRRNYRYVSVTCRT